MTQQELIQEEQKKLNWLIHDMDAVLLELNHKLTDKELQAKKAKTACLPDTYGMLVSAEHEKVEARRELKRLYQIKDELYDTRLELECTMGKDCDEDDIKIGLHTYSRNGRVFIMSWTMSLCRHYILDNAAEEFESVVTGKHGEKYYARYKLKKKRRIDMFFDKVKSVQQLFPVLNEEVEKIIADEFLQELLKRRTETAFKNIVFSIQQRQGAIIQTPFRQNLIVQGCAGSGKSMIMLHRLPIVLYDNPNSLDRNNLYIITPSKAYIQMANRMRVELEIEDIKMGTLEEYYSYVLGKYGIDWDTYGTTRSYSKVSIESEKYIYSKKCKKDIKRHIETLLEKDDTDYKYGYAVLGMTLQEKQQNAYIEKIRQRVLIIQALLNKNEQILREYHRTIYENVQKLRDFERFLRGRKQAVIRNINKKISEDEKIIISANNIIQSINAEEHQKQYQNQVYKIQAAQVRIADLKEVKEIVELDDQYFDIFQQKAVEVRELLKKFDFVKGETINMGITEQYDAVAKRQLIIEVYEHILEEGILDDDPYFEYVEESTDAYKETLVSAFEKLQSTNNIILPEEYYRQLLLGVQYLTKLEKTSVKETYAYMIKQMDQCPYENDQLIIYPFSQYLYLQIMYIFNGAPNGVTESLITIDEAQNVEVEELRLIKAVNKNRVVLNLFGDIKQHVEGAKGIDSWTDIRKIADFQIENMQENYRNARQITEFCNKRFRMNMHAINLDGAGVHEFQNYNEFVNGLASVFQKPLGIGLSCILVKSVEEATTVLKLQQAYRKRINDMTQSISELQENKWNLMTIEQAKGLEFQTVFAISGRMSMNEKYIAYTRALNELYVYNKELLLLPKSDDYSEKLEKEERKDNTRKKREKRKSVNLSHESAKSVKEFFLEKNMRIIDDRKKSGFLWVIGSKADINEVIQEAIELFDITGGYGSGKTSKFQVQEGWFTKTKK